DSSLPTCRAMQTDAQIRRGPPGGTELPALELLPDRAAELRGRAHRRHAGGVQRPVLVFGRALAARDDGTGVPHALPGRRGDAGDVGDDRLRHLGSDVLGGRFLVAPADLAHHQHALGLRVGLEQRQAVDEVHAAHGIAPDADTGALAQATPGRLVHRLVGQRAGARHDADAPLLVDETGHDADLALARRDDPGTVRPDQPAVVVGQCRLHFHHVEHRDALGDADDEPNAGVRRLEDRVHRERRRHVDHAHVGAGFRDRFPHAVEDRQAQVGLAAPPRRDAGDDLRAVIEALARMKGPLVARDALADALAACVDEYAHAAIRQAAAATTFFAASVRSSAAMMSRPLSARSSRPFSTFVPSSLTTTGTPTPTSLTAAMMPSAIRSQRTMPPKMLTRIAFTCSFDKMSLKAAVTRSLVAPPPTSRKFAGSPPWSLIRSIVAMASPAPLTMHAMSPSSET